MDSCSSSSSSSRNITLLRSTDCNYFLFLFIVQLVGWNTINLVHRVKFMKISSQKRSASKILPLPCEMFTILLFGRSVFVMCCSLLLKLGTLTYVLFLTLQPVLVQEWVYLVEKLFY